MSVGIWAIECYFPKLYVEQTDLERHDDCVGKYTKGLGLRQMGVCSAYEDTASQALTVTKTLLTKYNIDKTRIGRIDCATESLIDKSKSIKSILMQLFESENTNIEGADNINACYGGTAALFNALSWADSSFNYDDKLALVVASDAAVYDPNGSPGARATGGAGAIAILVGRNAPHITMNPRWRASYSKNVWDFYKPDMSCPFPTVDAPATLTCYMQALDNCCGQLAPATENGSILNTFDYLIFHSPFYKIVEKSFARLYKNEITKSYINKTFDENNNNEWTKAIEKEWMGVARQDFENRVHPSLTFSQRIGNMYTPSIYSSLVSLIANLPDMENPDDTKNVSLFSYGSGLISSIFGITIHNTGQVSDCDDCFSLENLKSNFKQILTRLDQRNKVTPQQFLSQIATERTRHRPKEYSKPSEQQMKETLFPDTYYLSDIDDKFRRTYGLYTETVESGLGDSSSEPKSPECKKHRK